MGNHSESPAVEQNKKRYFQNLGIIGAGSFSQVFKVRNTVTHNIYALKKLTNPLNTKEAFSGALNEVEIMKILQNDTSMAITNAGNDDNTENDKNDDEGVKMLKRKQGSEEISNKHIVRFYDHWISFDRQLHQIYDYYESGTLEDIVEHNNRLNHLQILQIMEQICCGLQYIHSLNVIHLDLKPSNIFCTQQYILKIGDFGISVNLNKHTAPKYRYSGDPIYIAPELMNFERNINNINKNTDIFSLGIILLELLCDIQAPSQGQIFQNLRNNAVDFEVVQPSPIVPSKFRMNRNDTSQSQLDFCLLQHEDQEDDEEKADNKDTEEVGKNLLMQNNHNTSNINIPDGTDIEIVENVDNDIKCLCKQMLCSNANERPNCTEILELIANILNNDRYSPYFSECKAFTALSLPPKQVILETVLMNDNNRKSYRKSTVSTSRSNTSCYNSNIVSQCNRDSASLCMNYKRRSMLKHSDSFELLDLFSDSSMQHLSNLSQENQEISNFFWQASPKCYNQLIERTAEASLSPIPFNANINNTDYNQDGSQFNLNSVFQDAEHNNSHFVVFSSDDDQEHKDDLNEQEEWQDMHNAEELDTDFKPKNLLLSFTK